LILFGSGETGAKIEKGFELTVHDSQSKWREITNNGEATLIKNIYNMYKSASHTKAKSAVTGEKF